MDDIIRFVQQFYSEIYVLCITHHPYLVSCAFYTICIFKFKKYFCYERPLFTYSVAIIKNSNGCQEFYEVLKPFKETGQTIQLGIVD